ncbi:hypothetical protein Pcinc_042757 [Petrolisthes cinctipes]|uniref:Uncharacterized protein n=1 Tax=Petrolisthes cinctipes TaxID=88211 RepID=A0AAE1BI36_PETCI|nr:hypothetical protein Pcinc_042757 [Petrolisthes cinctipes]
MYPVELQNNWGIESETSIHFPLPTPTYGASPLKCGKVASSPTRKKTLARLPLPSPPLHPTLPLPPHIPHFHHHYHFHIPQHHHIQYFFPTNTLTSTSHITTTSSTFFPPSPPHPHHHHLQYFLPTITSTSTSPNTTTSNTFFPQIPSHPHSPTPTRPTPAQHHNLHFPGGYLWPVEQESGGLLSGGGGRKVLGRQENFIGGADGFAADGEKGKGWVGWFGGWQWVKRSVGEGVNGCEELEERGDIFLPVSPSIYRSQNPSLGTSPVTQNPSLRTRHSAPHQSLSTRHSAPNQSLRTRHSEPVTRHLTSHSEPVI